MVKEDEIFEHEGARTGDRQGLACGLAMTLQALREIGNGDGLAKLRRFDVAIEASQLHRFEMWLVTERDQQECADQSCSHGWGTSYHLVVTQQVVTQRQDRPVALVTGASSGIGETFARHLAARGYDLILVARREDRLRALAAELPVTVTVVKADLTEEAGLAVAERAIRDCARLELLVNNAGFGTLKRFWEAELHGQEQMHRLHVMAVVRLTHAALGMMVARGHGGIIGVSSVAAFGQTEGNVSYCATKAWMNAFTQGLDVELRGVGSAVKVQALCPGFTLSEFHDTLGVDRAKIPGFLWLQADAVVEASLHALERGKVIVIPGAIYKIGSAVMRHLSHEMRRRLGKPGKLGGDKRV